MVSNEMTTQEAIHIVAEEAVRCRRLEDDLAKDPLDQDGRALEHAKAYRKKADAIPRMRNGKSRILLSITPRFVKNYEGSQCWHGCDKVSVINGQGGGGS